MDERIKIQAHLERLRQECIKDYLQSKLQPIASKEVVSDILMGFLETNNKEFLENITQSILEAKESNKILKATIGSMQRQNEVKLENEIIRVKQVCNKQHQHKIILLREDFNLIRTNLENYIKQKERQIQAFEKQINESNSQNYHQSQLIGEIKIKMNCLMQDNQKIKYDFECRLNQQMGKSKESQSIVRLQAQTLKNQYEEQIKYLKHHLEDIALKNNIKMQQMQSNRIVQIEEQKQKLLILLNQKSNRQQQTKKLSIQLQKAQYTIQQIIKENQQFNSLILEKQKLVITLSNNFIKWKQESQYLLRQIEKIRQRHKQQFEQHAKEINLKSLEIQTAKNENHILSKHITDLQSQIEHQNKQLSRYSSLQEQATHHSHIHTQRLNILEETLKAQNKQYSEQSEQLALNQEQIKSLMRYNRLQGQQIQKYEQQLKELREESRQQIIVYQQTLKLNISALENEIREIRQENQVQRKQLFQLKEKQQINQQRQKYYAIYLSEIAFLKSQLSQKNIIKNIFKYQSVLDKVQSLQTENQRLKRSIKNQIQSMYQNVQQTVKVVVDQLQSQSIKCLHCQHQKIYVPKLPSFDKTVPKTKPNIQSATHIKRNLKEIQQKYYLLNQQNQSFNNRVGSILNKN